MQFKKINITLRDFSFITFGLIVSILMGGYFNFRYVLEIKKMSVVDWINKNSLAMKEIRLKNNARLVSNTAQPGTIWIVFDNNSYSDEKLKNILFLLAKNECPYGVTQISK
jgi:hypothetical protein